VENCGLRGSARYRGETTNFATRLKIPRERRKNVVASHCCVNMIFLTEYKVAPHTLVTDGELQLDCRTFKEDKV